MRHGSDRYDRNERQGEPATHGVVVYAPPRRLSIDTPAAPGVGRTGRRPGIVNLALSEYRRRGGADCTPASEGVFDVSVGWRWHPSVDVAAMTYKVLAVVLLSISMVTHAACACSQAFAHSEVSSADGAHDCCPGGKAP